MGELLAAIGDVIGSAWVLAKDMGKGGGGAPDDPTVCIVVLPIALAVGALAASDLRTRRRPRAA